MEVIKSPQDALKLSQEAFDFLVDNGKKYVESRSTTMLLVNGATVVVSFYIVKTYIDHFLCKRKRKLNGPLPLPLFGNLLSYCGSMREAQIRLTKKYGKHFLFYEGPSPVHYISDPALIKQISIRDFQYFVNRRTFGLENMEPFDKFLTTLADDEWKNARSVLSTAFTTGKLKYMMGSIGQTVDNFEKHVEELISKDELFDTRKLLNFASDALFSTFFGIDVDTISNPDHPLVKVLAALAPEITDPKVLIFFISPKLAQLLGMDVFDLSYLTQIANQIIEERRSKAVRRNDFVQVMVDHGQEDEEEDDEKESIDGTEGPKTLKKTLTNKEIIGNALTMMSAGTDTTGNALIYICYNLAMYPDCQNKLFEEINEALVKTDGEITYELLNSLSYLSDVISESQRLYGIGLIDRVAKADYFCDNARIFKGDTVQFLLDVMHHDESAFPEAFKFDPERERSTQKFSPFGNGPRICIAQRFALLEMKFLIVKLISKYRFDKCDKTPEIIVTDNSGFSKSKVPIFLKFVNRT